MIEVAQWDTEAKGVDKYGPIGDPIISTGTSPIRVGIILSNWLKPRTKSTHALGLIEFQEDYHGLGYRKSSIGGYLTNKLYEISSIAMGDNLMQEISREEHAISTAFASIENQQRVTELAEEMVDYYRSKFTMKKLQDKPLSKFQETVFEYMNRKDHGDYKQREVGMIASLTQMYESDIEIERCSKLCNSVTESPIDGRIEIENEIVEVIGGYMPLGQRSDYVLLTRDYDLGRMIRVQLKRSNANKFLIACIIDNPNIMLSTYGKINKTIDVHYIDSDTATLLPAGYFK